MDQYLDPTLGGSLTFLDGPIQLEQTEAGHFAGPSQHVGVLDFDQWLNPVSSATYEAAPGMAVAGPSGELDPHAQDGPDLPVPPPSSFLPPTDFHAYASPVQSGSYGPLAAAASLRLQHPAQPEAKGTAESQQVFPVDTALPHLETPLALDARRKAPLPATRSTSSSLGAHASPNNATTADPATYSIAAYGSPKAKPSLAVVASRSHMTRAAAQSAQQQYIAYQSPPVSPARTRRSPRTALGQGPRLYQADESVPEAALHLLRLAQPDGSAASVASTSTRAGGGDDATSADDDGEGHSDDTSIHSTGPQNKSLAKMLFGPEPAVAQHAQLETRVWQHNPDQPPLHVQRGGGPNSPRPSVASSVTSTFGPRPGVAHQGQRAPSVHSSHSRAASEAPSVGSASRGSPAPSQPSRRSSARVRQLRGTSSSSGTAKDEMYDDDYADDDDESVYEDAKESVRSGRPAKRNLLAENRPRAAPAKRGRPPKRKDAPTGPQPPRKARRQVYLPPTLEQRTLAPQVEVHSGFPRFYRKFPVSSAFHPECFVMRPPTGSRTLPNPPRAQPIPAAGPPQPATPLSLYEDAGFGASHYYGDSASALASTSTGLPGIPVDVASPYHVYGMSHDGADSHFSAAMGAGPSTGFSPSQFPSHIDVGASTSAATIYPSSPKASTSLPLTPVSASPSGSIGPGGVPLLTGPNGLAVMQPPPESKWNKVSDPLNLYWPRFIKGVGDEKCGLCPICAEPPERGGDGEQKWFKVLSITPTPQLSPY